MISGIRSRIALTSSFEFVVMIREGANPLFAAGSLPVLPNACKSEEPRMFPHAVIARRVVNGTLLKCTALDWLFGSVPVTREKLQEVRDWVDGAIASPEMSVAWYELMKVRESLDAVLGSPDIVAVFLREDLPKMPRGSCSHLRLVESETPSD